MSLIPWKETWDPFSEMEALSNRMGRFFGMPKWKGNGEGEALATTDWAPSCDISENDREYRIAAELPKVKKDDVHVTLDNGVLTIQGERREEKEEKDVKFHRRELSYGSFMRRFSVPENADDTKVMASFKDGILHVTLPKTKTKQTKAKQIAVN